MLTPDTHQDKIHPSIFIENSHLPLVKCPRILGVYLDPSLSFNKHSQYVAERVTGRNNIHTYSEKELTRKERSTLAQLRSGYCRLLGSYKRRIKKDASLDVCADCGTTPHDVKHLFVFPAHPTTPIPSDLWSRPTDAVRELSYLEARDPD